MIYALIAHGPNNIEIPCMFWISYDRAREESIKILGEPTFDRDNKYYWTVLDNEYQENVGSMFLIRKPNTKKLDPYGSSNRSEHLAKIRAITNPIPASKIFYGGCGEVGSFTLCSLQEGTPCIRFNLD